MNGISMYYSQFEKKTSKLELYDIKLNSVPHK